MHKPANDKEGKTIHALILAAGSSKRMGQRNKLLATVDDVPMVRLVAQAALASKVDSVIVVTGFEAQEIRQALQLSRVEFVHNPDYASGMASSLRVGLRSQPVDTDGILVMLGDMPFVKPEQIDLLIDEFTRLSDDVIIVPVFDGRPGNPRLWANSFFEEMCDCDGDVGARHLIKKHSTMVRRVAMNDATMLTDIDTPEELAGVTGNLAKKG